MKSSADGAVPLIAANVNAGLAWHSRNGTMQTSTKPKTPWRLVITLGFAALLAGCVGPPGPGYVGVGVGVGPDYYGPDYYDYGYGWPYVIGPDYYVFGHHGYGHFDRDFERRGFESRREVGGGRAVGGFRGGTGRGGGFRSGGGLRSGQGMRGRR